MALIPGVRSAGVILKGLTSTPAGDRLLYADSSKNLLAATVGNGVALSGGALSNTLITGLSGGQTIQGDTASGGNIRIDSTSHATKGRINLNGTSTYVDAAGILVVGFTTYGSASTVLAATNTLSWSGRSAMYSTANGIIVISNNAGTDFTRLILGPTTSSGAAIVRSGTGIQIKNGDSSAFTDIKALTFTPSVQQTYTASNVTTDRTYDANATTTDELADVLGTLIADLRSIGLVL